MGDAGRMVVSVPEAKTEQGKQNAAQANYNHEHYANGGNDRTRKMPMMMKLREDV